MGSFFGIWSSCGHCLGHRPSCHCFSRSLGRTKILFLVVIARVVVVVRGQVRGKVRGCGRLGRRGLLS